MMQIDNDIDDLKYIIDNGWEYVMAGTVDSLSNVLSEIERLRANEKVLIDALEECDDVFSELDGVDWHEDSDFQYSSYSDTKEKIEQALAQVKHEN